MKEDPCFSVPHPLKSHISCDQFLISRFSLGMGIGKKHHALREAWARVYNHTIPNKVSQAIDSLASTFEGWSYREIYNYGKQLQLIQSWKFES